MALTKPIYEQIINQMKQNVIAGYGNLVIER